MPRTPRIQYNDAFYHVINRGRARSNIFHSKVYYQLFLDIISDVALKYNIRVHAYCLMSNHYHLPSDWGS